MCVCTCLCVYVCKYGQICATVQVWGSEELSRACSHLPLCWGRVSLVSDTALYIPCQLTHVLLEDSSVSTSHITTGVLVLQNHITTSTSLRWDPGIKFHLSDLYSDAFLLLRHLFGVQLYAFKSLCFIEIRVHRRKSTHRVRRRGIWRAWTTEGWDCRSHEGIGISSIPIRI